MNPVSIITIKEKHKLFKKEESANSIELLSFEEVGFKVVSGKDNFQVGDKVVFIQPDYCVPDSEIFSEYVKPDGGYKKSRLGSNNRVRAIKFNFHTGDNNPVYSEGIVLPYKLEYGAINDLQEHFGITKYEEPENNKGSGIHVRSGNTFPKGMYKTDETNYKNLFNKIEYPIHLIGTEKIDGSSISLYYKDGKYGVCSRNLDKPLFIEKVIGRRKPTFIEKVKQFFGKTIDLNIKETVESDDDFVVYSKEYLNKFVEYCSNLGVNLVLRGELNGGNLKGSGNKNNPARKEKPNIKFYGVDLYTDVTTKLSDGIFDELMKHLDFSRCKVVFNQVFTCKEDLENTCAKYFQDNMIEGIVLRNFDSSFSCKFMNPEYDSKK